MMTRLATCPEAKRRPKVASAVPSKEPEHYGGDKRECCAENCGLCTLAQVSSPQPTVASYDAQRRCDLHHSNVGVGRCSSASNQRAVAVSTPISPVLANANACQENLRLPPRGAPLPVVHNCVTLSRELDDKRSRFDHGTLPYI